MARPIMEEVLPTGYVTCASFYVSLAASKSHTDSTRYHRENSSNFSSISAGSGSAYAGTDHDDMVVRSLDFDIFLYN